MIYGNVVLSEIHILLKIKLEWIDNVYYAIIHLFHRIFECNIATRLHKFVQLFVKPLCAISFLTLPVIMRFGDDFWFRIPTELFPLNSIALHSPFKNKRRIIINFKYYHYGMKLISNRGCVCQLAIKRERVYIQNEWFTHFWTTFCWHLVIVRRHSWKKVCTFV